MSVEPVEIHRMEILHEPYQKGGIPPTIPSNTRYSPDHQGLLLEGKNQRTNHQNLRYSLNRQEEN